MARDIARIAGTNFLEDATFIPPDPAAWPLGLANLVNPALVSAPARCVAGHDLSKSQFVVDMGRRRTISVVHFEAVTLDTAALYRLTYASENTPEAFAASTQTTGWARVIPRVHSSPSLQWSDTNWWRGRPTDRELAAYGRRVVVPLAPSWSGRYLRVEFDDRSNPATYFDLGYGFVDNWFTPPFNYSRGASQGLEFRTLVDEAPSGHQIFEVRRSRRTHDVPFNAMTKDGWAKLYDMAVMNGPQKPVLFVPTLADPKNLYREAFLGRLRVAPARELIGPRGLTRTRIEIGEIVA